MHPGAFLYQLVELNVRSCNFFDYMLWRSELGARKIFSFELRMLLTCKILRPCSANVFLMMRAPRCEIFGGQYFFQSLAAVARIAMQCKPEQRLHLLKAHRQTLRVGDQFIWRRVVDS